MTTVYVPSADGPYVRAEFDGCRIRVDGYPVPRRFVAVVYFNPGGESWAAHNLARTVQRAGYSCFVRQARN
jgi:hypothetical protein